MSLMIAGWIEVARSPDTSDEYAWCGVVDLSSLVAVADKDTERLFGLSKLCVSGDKSGVSLAANRGVPPNPSGQVRRELEEIAALEAKHGSGEVGGYTYATWREIRGYKLTSTEPQKDSQWKLAFALARILEEQLGPDRIRFVVWLIW